MAGYFGTYFLRIWRIVKIFGGAKSLKRVSLTTNLVLRLLVGFVMADVVVSVLCLVNAPVGDYCVAKPTASPRAAKYVIIRGS